MIGKKSLRLICIKWYAHYSGSEEKSLALLKWNHARRLSHPSFHSRLHRTSITITNVKKLKKLFQKCFDRIGDKLKPNIGIIGLKGSNRVQDNLSYGAFFFYLRPRRLPRIRLTAMRVKTT